MTHQNKIEKHADQILHTINYMAKEDNDCCRDTVLGYMDAYDSFIGDFKEDIQAILLQEIKTSTERICKKYNIDTERFYGIFPQPGEEDMYEEN